MKFEMPIGAGNAALKDPQFGHKIGQLLAEIKAEAAYFTTINGNRGAYIIVNMTDASQMPAIAEPFFLWLQGKVEWIPCMTPQDLQKAGPGIEAAVKKWA